MRGAALVLLALLARGASAAAPAGDATVALNFQDVDIPVLAKFVSEVTGRNFIVDERVRGKVTIISPTRLTPDEAYSVFQSVLQVKGFSTVPAGAFTKIVPIRDATQASAGGGDEIVTRVVPLAHADAAALVPVLQPLVSKDGVLTAHPATNRLVVVDAAGNVDRLAKLAGELDRPGTAAAAETIALRTAPADEIAKRLRDTVGGETTGLRVVAEPRTNSLVLSGPPDEIARARTIAARLDVAPLPGSASVHVYRLKNADAGSLVRVLAQLVGSPLPPEPEPRPQGSSFMRRSERLAPGGSGYGFDGFAGAPPERPTVRAEPASTGTAATIPLEAPVRITADPATNALIVSATPQDWRTLAGVVRELDVRRRQVFVEAIILEVTTDKLQALGIELQGAGSAGATVGLGQVNLGGLGTAASDPTSLPGLILAAASNKLITLPSGQQVPAYTVLLTALRQDNDVNVLSAPNIATTDNEEAEIVVGRNVPFVASRATSSANLSNLFTTIDRQDVGITLRMTPQIVADDYVRMTIFEEVSDIDVLATQASDPALGPTTTVRSASTVIAARDAQTVVIGGLLSDTVRSRRQSVPFLGDVPVLGNLFRRSADERIKTNLLIFLTPHVVASDAQMAERSAAERAKLPALRGEAGAAVERGETAP